MAPQADATVFALVSLVAVAPPQSGNLSDAGVSSIVDRELFFDRAVSSHRVDVETEDGVATLRGTVDNLLAKERAARVAQTVKGVRAVVNLLQVEPAAERTDEEIRSDVLAALLADPAADAYEVSVAVVPEGHVVLSGKVDSWKERELSAKVAKGIRGVRELTNDIEVVPATERTDLDVAHDVREALRWNALVDHALIEVQVEDGAVRLSGTVGSAAESREATATAWTLGVTSVDASDLSVERWARDDDLRKGKYAAVDDEEVRRAIEAALAEDPRVGPSAVRASVSDGTVTLRGVVEDLRAKRAAEQDARNTVGVALVSNLLKVRPEHEREDGTIETDVREALLRDPYVERYEVTVDAHDGTVYLLGSVDSFFEKAQAADVAARVAGVTRVANNLTVDDSPYAFDPYVDDWNIYDFEWYRHAPSYSYTSDTALEKAIEDEIFWSPFVDGDEVRVDVVNGVATLSGSVDSWMESGAARDNAYEAGATYVRNLLRVGPSDGPEDH